MPLLERGELLEGERVDLAELGEQPLGGTQPALLVLAVVRDRRRRRVVRLGIVRVIGTVRLGGRHPGRIQHRRGDVRSEVAHQVVQAEAELVEHPLLELFHPHPVLGEDELLAVHVVGESRQLRLEGPHGAARLDQLPRPPGPGPSTGHREPRSRPRCHRQPLQHGGGGHGDGSGDRCLTPRPVAPAPCLLAGLPLASSGLLDRLGTLTQGARPLLGCPQRQPGVHLDLARRARRLAERLAGERCPGRRAGSPAPPAAAARAPRVRRCLRRGPRGRTRSPR